MTVRRSVRLLVLAAFVALIAASAVGCGSKSKSGSNGSISPAEKSEGKGSQTPAQIAQQKKAFSTEPPPVQLLTGDTTGYYVNKPTVVVMHDNKAEKAVLKRHFSHGVKTDEPADTDFTTRQVVALFLPKSPNGTFVVITDVHQQGNAVVVKAIELLKGKHCDAAPGRPRPFHFVETRKMKSTGKTILKLTKQRAAECKK